jgi:hypothetical protein
VTFVALAAALLALAAPADDTPTWHGGVEQLVARRCGGCHVDGGPAPFDLVSYDDVASRAQFVRYVVDEGLMPPWLPDDRGPALAHDNRLTADERRTLSRWVAEGRPRGERSVGSATPRDIVTPADATPVEATPAAATPASARAASATSANSTSANATSVAETAALGAHPTRDGATAPGVVRADQDGPWALPAEGARDMRSFVLPLGNNEPLRVRAVSWTSSEPTALHGVTLLADPHGIGAMLDGGSSAAGYDAMGDVGLLPSGTHGALGVGLPRLQLPDGYVFELPARSDLVAEVHAQPVGRPLQLTGSVELTLHTGDEPARALAPLSLLVTHIDVPAGEADHRLQDEIELPCAVDLVGVLPRAGSVCRQLELTRRAPPGDAAAPPPADEVLLSIPDWNPHFRRPFLFREPVRLEPGTRLSARWLLDNSADNLANPSAPPKRVALGGEPDDELLAMLLWVAPVDPADAATLRSLLHQLTMDRMRDMAD